MKNELNRRTKPEIHAGMESAVKSAISIIPYIGTLLNEIMFDFRSRVKQDRLNRFIEHLRKEMEGRDSLLEVEMTPALSDFVESVMKKAASTNSEKKRVQLANILVGRISNYNYVDFEEQFLSLICELTEKQFEILATHSRFHRAAPLAYREMKDINTQITFERDTIASLTDVKERLKQQASSNLKIQELSKRKNAIMKSMPFSSPRREPLFYGIDSDSYASIVYDLIGRGLMHDVGLEIGTYRKLEVVELTPYGRLFVNYVSLNIDESYNEYIDPTTIQGIKLSVLQVQEISSTDVEQLAGLIYEGCVNAEHPVLEKDIATELAKTGYERFTYTNVLGAIHLHPALMRRLSKIGSGELFWNDIVSGWERNRHDSTSAVPEE